MDVVALSRLQFALTTAFHYIFPPLAIGLGLMLVILERRYMVTKDPDYERVVKFWTRIYGLNFAIGVATGIILEFEFGTNWSTYSRFVGDIFGSPLAAEGVFAFFLESTFLGVLIFGWNRVGPKTHYFSTWMVFLGSIFSSIWIIVANSWQQTPAGYHIVERVVNGVTVKRAEITDFWQAVFNPSTIHRLLHVWMAAFILGAFFVMSVAAYFILKKRDEKIWKEAFTNGLWVGAIFSILVLVSGHFQADMVANQQPTKIAAFEGLYKTTKGGAPLYLWGWPDDQAREVKYGFAIPGGLSFLVHGDFQKPVPALDTFPPGERPTNVAATFITYHVMVALGMLFILYMAASLFFHLSGTLFRKKWLLRFAVIAVVFPLIANETGWGAAELGRQPWIVWKLLKTKDGVSPILTKAEVTASLVMFTGLFTLLGLIWLFLLTKKIRAGLEPVPAGAAGPEEGALELELGTGSSRVNPETSSQE